MKTTAQKTLALTLALLVLLAGAVLCSLMFGTRDISSASVIAHFFGTSGVEEGDAAVLDQRFVRTVWALIIGASLALAGAGMQGVTRNPLGDPGLLGVNAGASFAVVTGIVFFSASSTSTFAFLALGGAITASVLVYALASIGRGGATPVKLALMGAALTAAFSSLTSAMVLNHQNSLDTLRKWQVGAVSGASWDKLFPVIILLAIGAFILLTGAKTINNFALGDDMATALGENVAVKRLLIACGITLLCGTCVALCGPIGFIGLMAPHAMRSLTGPDYRRLIPLSALFGGVLLTIADTLGRILMPPQEIEVGVSMILVGVPVFIYLVRRNKAVDL